MSRIENLYDCEGYLCGRDYLLICTPVHGLLQMDITKGFAVKGEPLKNMN